MNLRSSAVKYLAPKTCGLDADAAQGVHDVVDDFRYLRVRGLEVRHGFVQVVYEFLY